MASSTKRPRSESDEENILDQTFQKRQRYSESITVDMENVMDDWFTSSNLSRAQREGSNIKKGPNESPESFEENKQKEEENDYEFQSSKTSGKP